MALSESGLRAQGVIIGKMTTQGSKSPRMSGKPGKKTGMYVAPKSTKSGRKNK